MVEEYIVLLVQEGVTVLHYLTSVNATLVLLVFSLALMAYITSLFLVSSMDLSFLRSDCKEHKTQKQ